ncbi:hypothetical protein GN958_ATG18606 [Phytophthora infestans]|uniref:Uncharacterized protein n=1 Tax=Phytophthora infestans TaxID=4787 RepID=A0A8S9TZX0_PHYIN|nr:hypothetical protein GN958_ATG18606 [Phytophthora infestans]
MSKRGMKSSEKGANKRKRLKILPSTYPSNSVESYTSATPLATTSSLKKSADRVTRAHGSTVSLPSSKPAAPADPPLDLACATPFVQALRAPLSLPLLPPATPISDIHVYSSGRSGAELLGAIDSILSASPEDEMDPQSLVVTADVVPKVITPAKVTNWTVKNPGKVLPPKINDYKLWTVAQLRKECTERSLRLSRATSKQEQIRYLRLYDATKRAVEATVDEDILLEPGLRKTNNCFIRLMNIIFSDRFAERLARSDDTVTREQLDVGEVNDKSTFWKDVGVEFRRNTTDYNKLFDKTADNPRFGNVNPSMIVHHDDAKLYAMWKKGNAKYKKAQAKIFVSGQNSNDFYIFCDGNLDALYLKICTEVKPELEHYVNGGMHPEDEIDSLKLAVSRRITPTNKTAKWQNQVVSTVTRMADYLMGAPVTSSTASLSTRGTQDESQLIDRIAKLHQLIAQVKESQRKSEMDGATDPSLEASLLKYQQRLHRYENQLEAMD